MDQPINERMLIQAIRQRMLDDIRAKKEAQAIINNNVYGGRGGDEADSAAGGIRAGMHDAAPSGDDDRDYFVDILRENLDPENPNKGWRKKVHRFSANKNEDLKKKDR